MPSPSTLALASGTVDLVRAELQHPDGTQTQLTTRECALLDFLARRPQAEVSRDTLLVEVWEHRSDSLSRAVDHTMRRLRAKVELDPARPQHLLTVHGVGYRFVPLARPSPVSTDSSSDFVGRASELAALRSAVAPCVQVLGPGGVGKTRLVREWMPATARFVDLSAATSKGQVVAAVARVLGVGRRNLAAALADTAPMLILDNAEQVVGPLADWLKPWLEGAPGPRFVVTSRVELVVPGPIVRVTGLDPAPAAALYRHHARGLDAQSAPTDAAISRLVACLDGLPLAIELAAARAPLLGPAELAARLEGSTGRHASFSSLGQQPQGPARHRGLDAALDGSWSLLDPLHQDALARLAAFSGGFGVASIEGVLGPSGVAIVEALAAASLVVVGEDRGRLAESVRDYVRRSRPDAASAGERAHLDHFRAWCARPHSPAEVAAEYDNLLAAARYAATHNLPHLDLVEALEPVLAAQGPPEIWAELARGVRLVGPRGARVLARLHLAQGDAPAAEATLAAVASSADRDAEHHLLVARIQRARRDFEAAEAALDACEAWASPGSDVAARLVHQRGLWAIDHGQWTAAVVHLQAARRAWETLERPADRARAALHLGHVALEVGDVDEAVARYAQARTSFASDSRGWALATVHWALALAELGDLPAAWAALTEARGVFVRLGDRRFTAFADLVAAECHLEARDPRAARRTAAGARSVLADLGDHTYAAAASARILVACATLADGPGAQRAADRARTGLPARHRDDTERLVDALLQAALGNHESAHNTVSAMTPTGHFARRLATHLRRVLAHPAAVNARS